jgi:hypothetical protein
MTGTMTGGGGFTNMTCLQTPGAANAPKLISLQQCGNGIVEAGEDCDPGAEGASACCDSNCKFRSGAVCDPASSPCCTPTCGFAPSSQTCRPSKDSSCDIAEMCTGNSGVCPADAFQPNGQDCGNGLACASGVCTSPSSQWYSTFSNFPAMLIVTFAEQCQQQGTSLNLQSACPQANNNCQLSCQDPSNSHQCITMQTKLLDGSPCGYGGSCSSGSCKSGSLFATVKAWAIQNPYIAIPAGIGIGLVVLLVLYFLISGMPLAFARKIQLAYGRRHSDPALLPAVQSAGRSGPNGPTLRVWTGGAGGAEDRAARAVHAPGRRARAAPGPSPGSERRWPVPARGAFGRKLGVVWRRFCRPGPGTARQPGIGYWMAASPAPHRRQQHVLALVGRLEGMRMRRHVDWLAWWQGLALCVAWCTSWVPVPHHNILFKSTIQLAGSSLRGDRCR